MATTNTLFDSFRKYIGDGTIDWDTDTIKLALVTSGYTFSAAHTIWGDVSANEVANGAGYTTGGLALTTKAVTMSGANAKYTADNALFSALTKTFRRGIVYKSGTTNGIVNALVCAILFDDTPADIVITGVDFTTSWNANGVVRMTP